MREEPCNVRTVAFVALIFLAVPIAAQITTPRRPPARDSERTHDVTRVQAHEAPDAAAGP